MNLALFDFDGTITSTDSWTSFMHFAVPRWRLAAGQALLLPVVVGYRLGAMSASRGREIAARVAFQGERAAAIRQKGAEYATATIPLDVRRKALERIEWHRAQADRVVVVSAALDVYLVPWCQAQGVDVICTTLEERAGRFTGRYVYGDCSGAEKARRIRERYDLSQYASVYAYGDSGEDREMLECAHQKFYRWNPFRAGRMSRRQVIHVGDGPVRLTSRGPANVRWIRRRGTDAGAPQLSAHARQRQSPHVSPAHHGAPGHRARPVELET